MSKVFVFTIRLKKIQICFEAVSNAIYETKWRRLERELLEVYMLLGKVNFLFSVPGSDL